MLNEGERLILPPSIRDQIKWDKVEGVVILCLNKKGEQNEIHMSGVTVEELAFLTSQLNAHLTCLLGPMKEGST